MCRQESSRNPNRDALPLPRWPGNTLMTPGTIAGGEDAANDLVPGELLKGLAKCFARTVRVESRGRNS